MPLRLPPFTGRAPITVSTPTPPGDFIKSAVVTVANESLDNSIVYTPQGYLDITTGTVSLTVWLKTVSFSPGQSFYCFSKGEAGDYGSNWYLIAYNTGGDNYTLETGVWITALSSYLSASGSFTSALGDWNFFSMVKKSNQLLAYVNGVEVGASAINTNPMRTTGGNIPSNFVGGGDDACELRLWNPRIYTSALSPSELNDLYTGVDVTTNLAASISFDTNTAVDKVGSMDGTCGVDVTFVVDAPLAY